MKLETDALDVVDFMEGLQDALAAFDPPHVLDLDDPATVGGIAEALHRTIVGCRYDTENETYMGPCPDRWHLLSAKDLLAALRGPHAD